MRRFLLPMLLFAAGCLNRNPQADLTPAELQSETLYFELLTQGLRSRLHDTTETVIRDPEVWATFSKKLQTLEPIPEVDFSQVMVLAVAIPESTSGFQVLFDSVERINEEVVVNYTLLEPNDECIPTIGFSTPFQVIKVRRADDPVRFVRNRELYKCSVDR